MTSLRTPNASATALALALATDPSMLLALQAAYAKPVSPIGGMTVTVTANLTGSKLITPAERKGSKGKKPAKDEKSTRVVVVNFPCTGGLDAAGFLAGLRVAGKRPARYDADGADPVTGECWKAGDIRMNGKGEPIMVWDRAEQKKDEKACMVAFCGYSSGEAHGEQLDRAQRDAHARIGAAKRKDLGISFGDEDAHRSPLAHAARQEATEGYVKGLPNPIRALGMDLCKREEIAAAELDLFGELRSHAAAGEDVEFGVKLLGNFPYTRGVEQHTKLVARPIVDASGAKVKVDRRLVREAALEDAGYRVIEVPSPVVAPLLPFLHVQADVEGKVDGFKFRAGCAEDLDKALATLEALAYERLDQITGDLDALEREGASNPETVARVSAALHSRGATACIEEALRIYDPASRSHALLPVGSTVSTAAIDRDTASDSYGILNTVSKA